MSNSRKRKYGMDEMCANTSVPILFPLNTTVRNKPEDSNISKTEWCTQQNERTPLQNIADLPPEMVLNIFRKLDYASIARCAQVCKAFNELCKDSGLFRYVEVPFLKHESTKFAEWLLNRATNPREVYVADLTFSALISKKISTWHNLEKLELWYMHLEDVGEGSMVNLRSLSVVSCTINCKTLGKLLECSNAIRKLDLRCKVPCCCGEDLCNTGFLSFLDFKTCVDNLEEVTYSYYFTSAILPDLRRLSLCASLKTLNLSGFPEILTTNSSEATLAMEVLVRKCTKLERVTFVNLVFITDSVLEILFANNISLKWLTFILLPNITEKSCLRAIEVLSQLQKITAWGCELVAGNSEVD